MKAVHVLVWLLVCAGGERFSSAQGRMVSWGRTDFSGKNYVRLGDWARVNHFEVHWAKAGDSVQLSSGAARLFFNKDSREAELNGVKICLSYPILFRDGGGYISRVDLDTAIAPVLSPPKNARGDKLRNIVIDPGHGGKDPGNHDGSHQEKKYALLLAQELCEQLKLAGFNASLTRTSDNFIELPERPEIARRRGADLFISVHWNALPGKNEVNGAQVFCLTPAGASSSNAGGEIIGGGRKTGNRNDAKNMLLAFELQKSLLKKVGMEDRGVRRARYWVLREAEMPAVLIEGGFMTNPAEAKRIYDAAYRRQMARAIVGGVLAYQREVE